MKTSQHIHTEPLFTSVEALADWSDEVLERLNSNEVPLQKRAELTERFHNYALAELRGVELCSLANGGHRL